MNKITALPKELNTARWIGTFSNGSPEWHAQRTNGVGGSDAGVLAGLSPWESPYTWAAKRLGKIEVVDKGSEAMEWGNRLEPVVIAKLQDVMPELEIFTDCGSWQNINHEWQLANPDAIYRKGDDWGIIEIKTARYEDGWNEQTGEIPPHYRAQVLWYLQTFNFHHAYVAVLFAGSKFRVFEVVYDSFEADVNFTAAEIIWSMVQADTMPDFSAPYTSTYDTVRQEHPDIDPDGKVELGDLYIHYANALSDEEAAKEQATNLKARVLAALGKAKAGTYNDQVVVTRQSRNGGTPFLVNKKS